MKPIILSTSFVVALFICLSAKYASSLSCYECNTYSSSIEDDTACTKLKPSMITKCPESDKSVCRTLKAENSVSGIPYIKRSCGTLMFENIKEFDDHENNKRKFMEGVPVSSMICNTDLCNAAAVVGNPSTKMVLFISAMLSLSFYKYTY